MIVYFLSFILGILTKLYDEITDQTIKLSTLTTEITKYFIVGLTTFLSMNHHEILYMILASMIGGIVVDSNKMNIIPCENKNVAFNDPFWYGCFVYGIFLCILLTWTKESMWSKKLSILVFMLGVVSSFGISVIEPQYFPDEIPDTKNKIKNKLIFRCCFMASILAMFATNHKHSDMTILNIPIFYCLQFKYVRCTFIILLGYLCLSILSLLYLLNKQKINKKKIKKKKIK